MPSFTRPYVFAVALLVAGCGGSTSVDSPTDSASSDSAKDATPDSIPDTAVVDSAPGFDGGPGCFGPTGDPPSVPFKVCTNDTDCTTVHHQTDCCGSFLVMGVAKSQESDFLKCEKPWQEHFPLCECLGSLKTEDGKIVTDPTAVIVKCTDRTGTSGICKTSMP